MSETPKNQKSNDDLDLENTIVIIPMLNEERSIDRVLLDLPSVRETVICDNGSTDRGPEISRDLGATVVFETERGYGAACLKGMEYVASLEKLPEIIVFLDGDYSDHPDELCFLVEPILRDNVDLVIGSRMRGKREKGAMLWQAIFGNYLACFLMWIFWGAKYSDLGPFRAIRYTALRQLEMSDRNFGWTIEMQIKAVEKGLAIKEVPVSYRRRIGQSKISGTLIGSIRAGYKILYTIFRYRFLPRRKTSS